MQISAFSVHGLFDTELSHSIRMREGDLRTTIIHGANGIGKTTVLRLLSDLFSEDFRTLWVVPFSSLSVTFSTGTELTVKRKGHERVAALEFTRTTKSRTWSPFVLKRPTLAIASHMISRYIPDLVRVGSRRWHDEVHNITLTLEEVVERYFESLPAEALQFDALAPWLADLQSKVSIYFIETTRLRGVELTGEDDSVARRRLGIRRQRTAADIVRRSIQGIVESGRLDAAEHAGSLDRTFLSRVLGKPLPRGISEQSARSRYDAQREIWARLEKIGLAGDESPVKLPDTLNQDDLRLLWFHLVDVQNKLRSYIPLLERIELFLTLLNDAKLYGKRVELDRRGKLKAITLPSKGGREVDLNSLSSGEQHQLVLMHRLLFEAPTGSLVLLDEPELSLHIGWQYRLVDDLARIGRLRNLSFLLATHSPAILNGRRSLEVPLGGWND